MPLRHLVFLHLKELPVLYKVKCTIGNNKTRQVPALRFRFRKVSGLQESSLHQCKLSVQKKSIFSFDFHGAEIHQVNNVHDDA